MVLQRRTSNVWRWQLDGFNQFSTLYLRPKEQSRIVREYSENLETYIVIPLL